jgi:hypothetical protein
VKAAHAAASALAIAALLAPLWLAESADAQRRDFVGKVLSISTQSIDVKDRRGNIMTFARGGDTAVEGGSWETIRRGDQVLVRWNLGSGIARQVIVLENPPRPEAR